MRIYTISDSHTLHEQIEVPDNTDMIICSGDASNARDPYQNEPELRNYMNWFANQKAKYKVYVAGNHDTSIEKGLVTRKDFEEYGIIYLEHEAVTIEGLLIFGSPYTPTFGSGWAFNKDRAKLHNFWQHIPVDTDILVTHGPPKGILDLSTNRAGVMEYCGDLSLWKAVYMIQPRYHIFGHIHDYEEHKNHGIRTAGTYTTFVNASLIEDRKFDEGLKYQGILIET